MRVGLVFGGRSTEHRVSVVSARTVARALEAAGHEVVPLGIARDGSWVPHEASFQALSGGLDFVQGGSEAVVASLRHLLVSEVEILFPLVHGTWGEDGTLQGLSEMLDLPYAGAGVAASAVAMDKHLAKSVLAAAGLPVVEWTTVTDATFDPESVLGGYAPPFFVKPAVGGSSVGVEKVVDRAALPAAVERALDFDDRVLIERGVSGRELECSVLGYRTLEASRVGEIVPGRDFYDYRDKYIEEGAELQTPARLEEALEARVRRLAVDAFAAIGGHGMARVDFLVEGEAGVFVNEINTLPGFTSISMYPKLWEVSGLPIAELVDRLLDIGVARHRDRHELDLGIREFLDSLD